MKILLGMFIFFNRAIDALLRLKDGQEITTKLKIKPNLAKILDIFLKYFLPTLASSLLTYIFELGVIIAFKQAADEFMRLKNGSEEIVGSFLDSLILHLLRGE